MFEIKKRALFGGGVIYSSDVAGNLSDAVREYLKSLNGKRANLYGANLSRAYLSGANLYGANLGDAYLSGANLARAILRGAKISWSSHALISEILKSNSNGEIAKLEIAGLVLIQIGWCWEEFCSLDKPQDLKDWAMRTLSGWAWSDDDDVPKQLVQWCEENNVERKPWPGGQGKEGKTNE